MKTLIALFLLCSFPAKSIMPSELDTVRNNYRLAPEDKTVCKEMIALLENRKDPVSLAYLGAFRSIWAKHTPNPLTKLGTFRKGKKNIEAAVAAEPLNIEIRFVRLSVQLNAPGFLGYNSNIDEDKKFIMANRGTITSEVLKSMIDGIIE